MSKYKIPKNKLPELFEAAKRDVYLPIKKEGITDFGLYQSGASADLETLKALKSPKEFFLPQAENLYKGYTDGKSITIEPEGFADKPFIVFGVRACDLRGLEILDGVYLNDPIDKFYEARRKNGCIVTLACANPQATCFCKSFEIDAANPGGDISAWLVDEFLYMSPNTEKGEGLIKDLSELLEETDGAEAVKAQQEIQKKIEKLPYSGLSFEEFKDAEMLELFDSPAWDKLHEACIACGTCTFLCPTCQCYDITDFDTGRGVIRYRCWDSCMYSDFTLMAHGNPRTTQKERFRQRFMHKLNYHPSCVGCGRCVNKCPVSLNIVKVAKSLGVS
jgi:ferredoxin